MKATKLMEKIFLLFTYRLKGKLKKFKAITLKNSNEIAFNTMLLNGRSNFLNSCLKASILIIGFKKEGENAENRDS